MSNKKTTMRDDPSVVSQKPKSSEVDALGTTTGSSRWTTTPHYTKQSQRSKPIAQRELSFARRRLFLVQTNARFEKQFQYPLWESEKEYLAQRLHLKLERSGSIEDAIRDASSSAQRGQGPAKMAHSELQNEREICDDLKSIAVEENARDSTKYTMELAEENDDNELDEIEDKETEEALKWLGAEWDSLAKILKQRDPEINWEDVY